VEEKEEAEGEDEKEYYSHRPSSSSATSYISIPPPPAPLPDPPLLPRSSSIDISSSPTITDDFADEVVFVFADLLLLLAVDDGGLYHDNSTLPTLGMSGPL